MHRAELEFKLGSERAASAAWRALLPESRVALRNVRTHLTLLGDSLSAVIEAEDESALRAAVGSFIKLVYLVIEVLGVGGGAARSGGG